jgi:DnaJ-class molecular chaperone
VVPADVVFELQVKPHALFTREGDDLHFTCELSLQEALCDGFRRSIKTLDGKTLPLNMAKMPESQRAAIRGAGLPHQKRCALTLELTHSLIHSLTHAH